MERNLPKKFIIIGGGGYIGFHIGKALAILGHSVTLMDVRLPTDMWLSQDYLPSSYLMEGLVDTIVDAEKLNYQILPGSVDAQYEITVLGEDSKERFSFEFFNVDVRDRQKLEFYFHEVEDVDCVIHTASFGMSGNSQLPRFTGAIEEVNIKGLRHVINLSASIGAKAFVYTSTYNVVFGGQKIELGDETLPYFPLYSHVDSYSRTKSIAEQIALTADGKRGLRVCALRLAGVMGPMEERHLPRVVKNIERGLLVINYLDEKGSIVDFVGIQNVVQAHVKAALMLLQNGDQLGGKAYFISDGKPVNNMEYFRPLIEAKGRKFPQILVPMWLVFVFVYIIEVVANWCNFAPILTRAELYKTGVTHYFSVNAAREDFGYAPTQPNDMGLIIKYFSDLSKIQNSSNSNPR